MHRDRATDGKPVDRPKFAAIFICIPRIITFPRAVSSGSVPNNLNDVTSGQVDSQITKCSMTSARRMNH